MTHKQLEDCLRTHSQHVALVHDRHRTFVRSRVQRAREELGGHEVATLETDRLFGERQKRSRVSCVPRCLLKTDRRAGGAGKKKAGALCLAGKRLGLTHTWFVFEKPLPQGSQVFPRSTVCRAFPSNISIRPPSSRLVPSNSGAIAS